MNQFKPLAWSALIGVGILLPAVGGLAQSSGASVIDIGVFLPQDMPQPQIDVCYNTLDNEYFVVYSGQAPLGSEILPALLGQRIDAGDGTLIGEPVVIDAGSPFPNNARFAPAVTYSPALGGRYMVIFRNSGDLFACTKFLTKTGADIIGGVARYVSVSQGGWPAGVDVAYDDVNEQFMAVWTDVSYGLAGRRFNVDGQGAGARFIIEPYNGSGNIPDAPSISFLGAGANSYLVVYADSLEDSIIKCRRVTPDDQTGPASTVSSPREETASQIRPRVVANSANHEWLVAWERTDPEAPQGDIFFSRVAADGTPTGGPVALQQGPEADFGPDVAWSPIENAYSIVWLRETYQGGTIVSARVEGGSGTILGNGKSISPSAGSVPFVAANMNTVEGNPGNGQMLTTWCSNDLARVNGVITAVGFPLPTQLRQLQPDAATEIAVGAFTEGLTCILQAVVADIDGGPVRLQIEVRRIGSDFDDQDQASLRTSEPVPSGSIASVTLDRNFLVMDQGYHWRARAVNGAGEMSHWLRCGRNADPADADLFTRTNPSPIVMSAGQFAAGPGGTIAVGGIITDATEVVLRATLDDDDSTMRLEVEVRPVEVAFCNTASAASALVPAGTASLAIALPAAHYHWQYRAMDKFRAYSAWTSFGGNPESEADFEVRAIGSLGHGSCLQAAAGGSTGLAWCLVAAIPFLLLAGSGRRALAALAFGMAVVSAGPVPPQQLPRELPTEASWMAEGDNDSQFGFDVSSAGDINGDGFDDFVVVQPYVISISELPSPPGKIHLYLGHSSGPGTIPAWTITMDVAFTPWQARGAGDVNGDGFDDVIVSLVGDSNGLFHPNEVRLYLGGPQGLALLPAWTVEGQYWLLADGQYYCSLGISIAAVGDVNNDGFADFLVGEPYYTETGRDEGRVYLYLGGPGGPSPDADWVENGDPSASDFGPGGIYEGEHFGSSVASAGDVNGDGFDDLFIGASDYLHQNGRCFVFLGGPAGPAGTFDWKSENPPLDGFAIYGSSAAAGDFNDDGFGDVVVGAPGHHAAKGRVYLYLGSSNGLSTTPSWTFEGDQIHVAGFEIYPSLAFALSSGDVNGDGVRDLIVGDRYHALHYDLDQWSLEGRALVFLGGSTGLPASPDWVVDGSFLEYSGYSVSSAGDIDGDGRDDVLVGGPFYGNNYRNTWPIPPGSTLGTGCVRLYGPPPGEPASAPVPSPTSTLLDERSNGTCAGSAGTGHPAWPWVFLAGLLLLPRRV